MTSEELELRFRVGQALIRQVGQLAAGYFDRRLSLAVDSKGLQDFVSEADRVCEDLLVAGLQRAFPRDSFLGEERGMRNPGGEGIWVIDPIDGTQNFLTGVPIWCISVGLVVRGGAVLGLIYHPASDELFAAKRGEGACVNGSPMKVSGRTELSEARLSLGFSFRPPVADHISALDAVLQASCTYSRLGSAALSLAYTAAGRFDGFWQRHTNSWDAAAGLVLVREAGGWTNDVLGGDGLVGGNEILACTPGLAAPFARLTGLASRSQLQKANR